MNHRFARAVVATALSAAAGIALAQTDAQQIEVRAQPPVRTDVQALCPEIETDLPDALARTVQEVAEPALIDVRFELQGSRVGAVQVGPGPFAYQRMLKRVLRGLQCDSGDTSRAQVVSLRVRFVDPFNRSTRSAASAVSLMAASAPAR
jgi:hypothetical protein